jgi:hypothetical protein
LIDALYAREDWLLSLRIHALPQNRLSIFQITLRSHWLRFLIPNNLCWSEFHPEFRLGQFLNCVL